MPRAKGPLSLPLLLWCEILSLLVTHELRVFRRLEWYRTEVTTSSHPLCGFFELTAIVLEAAESFSVTVMLLFVTRHEAVLLLTILNIHLYLRPSSQSTAELGSHTTCVSTQPYQQRLHRPDHYWVFCYSNRVVSRRSNYFGVLNIPLSITLLAFYTKHTPAP